MTGVEWSQMNTSPLLYRAAANLERTSSYPRNLGVRWIISYTQWTVLFFKADSTSRSYGWCFWHHCGAGQKLFAETSHRDTSWLAFEKVTTVYVYTYMYMNIAYGVTFVSPTVMNHRLRVAVVTSCRCCLQWVDKLLRPWWLKTTSITELRHCSTNNALILITFPHSRLLPTATSHCSLAK